LSVCKNEAHPRAKWAAINPETGESCGTLFSIPYRNLVSHSLFNRDITGVQKAAGSKPEARKKSRASR
jgi:hypothetical protein